MRTVEFGAGRPYHYLKPTQISNIIKWNTMYQLDNIPSVALTKLSILLFVLRIVRVRQKDGIIAWTVYVTIAVTVLSTVLIEVAIGAQCIPLEALWNPLLSAQCLPAGLFAKLGLTQGSELNSLTE